MSKTKKKTKMQVMEIASLGEFDVFLKDDKIINYVHGNDGDWRHEYFDPILEVFGIKVVRRKKPLTKAHLAWLEEYGVTPEYESFYDEE
jgi:hypothetical protein